MTNSIIKECKIVILKRMLFLEEKYNEIGYISPFTHYEGILTVSNVAIWKVVKRGNIITPEDVRTAIYQLEKAGLLEIIQNRNVKFTEKGREVAKKLRPMEIDQVPDSLLEGEIPIPEDSKVDPSKEGKICPNCNKLNASNAKFCAFCGKKLIEKNPNICPYCGENIVPKSKFCSNCGASLE
ncbi:MAG: zinc-ribbon domain-containing protein [Candidatus Helarchaeota archaeon]